MNKKNHHQGLFHVHIIIAFLIFSMAFCKVNVVYAQKPIPVDRKIDKEDIRKIEQARRLFNESRVFDGEKIIKDLIKQNPLNVYYYEALVQMQKQVLDRIKYAGEEMDEMMITDNAEYSSEELDVMQSLGLDMTNINMKKESNDKKKKKDKKDEEKDNTIDPTLIFSYDDDDDDEYQTNNKLDKQARKKLKFLESFSQIPYDAYKSELILNARNATRLFPTADSSSVYLKKMLIDTVQNIDSIHPEAYKEYKTGLENFYEGNTVAAAFHFENAIINDYKFYDAYLKLGDAYFLLSKDSDAVRQYKLASLANESKPEPIERLGVMYYNRGKFKESAAAIIEAIMRYPHPHLFTLLKRIVEKTGRTFSTQWIKREVFPITTSHVNEEIVVDDKNPWWHYQAAKQDVYSYFDTLGIGRPNEKTNERYLELYGWKKMLNNASPKLFPFARVMEKVGYLDCYVFISCFHVDIYDQFLDFVNANPDKVKKYFYLLMNWEDKKYDKLRKSVEAIQQTSNQAK